MKCTILPFHHGNNLKHILTSLKNFANILKNGYKKKKKLLFVQKIHDLEKLSEGQLNLTCSILYLLKDLKEMEYMGSSVWRRLCDEYCAPLEVAELKQKCRGVIKNDK